MRPIGTENLGEAFQIGGGSLANGVGGITEPSEAKVAEFFVKEFNAEFTSDAGNVLDDGETYTPLFIFSEFDDGGHEVLREVLDANNFGGLIEIFDDI